jgi:hypothetical protein
MVGTVLRRRARPFEPARNELPNFALKGFSEVRHPQATPK